MTMTTSFILLLDQPQIILFCQILILLLTHLILNPPLVYIRPLSNFSNLILVNFQFSESIFLSQRMLLVFLESLVLGDSHAESASSLDHRKVGIVQSLWPGWKLGWHLELWHIFFLDCAFFDSSPVHATLRPELLNKLILCVDLTERISLFIQLMISFSIIIPDSSVQSMNSLLLAFVENEIIQLLVRDLVWWVKVQIWQERLVFVFGKVVALTLEELFNLFVKILLANGLFGWT